MTGGPAEVDLLHAGIGTIIWATGYRRSYPWLHVPVLGDHGDIRHVNGTTASPSLHVAGMRWADPAVFLIPGRGPARRRHGRLPGPQRPAWPACQQQERSMSAERDVVAVGGESLDRDGG